MIFGQESETLEFKKTTAEAREAVADVAAILNKHGRGELYFGIKDDGTVKGQTVSVSSLRDVSRALTENIKPQIYPTIEKVNINYKDCIRVQFEGIEPPYFAYGRAYIRVADESKQLSPAELERFFKKKQGLLSTWDAAPSGKTVEDVNTNTLRSYMKKANESGRLKYRFTDREDILNRLELLDDGDPNNTAIAMFGKKGTAEIQMAIFATDVKHTFIDIDRKKGTIIDLVDAGELYIRKNIHWRVVRDGAPQRTEVPEVPIEAVREALLNSYAHRDWRVPQTNEIAIYSNRIEIYNPGTFPEGLTPQDFIDGIGKSIRRNPLLAQIMYYSKDIESFGTGLRKIAIECEGAGVRYGFELGKLGFSVIFYRSDIYDEVGVDSQVATPSGSQAAVVAEESTVISDGNDGNYDGNDGNDGNQDAVLILISGNPRITHKELAESLGISEATVMRRVRELKKSGRLIRKGLTRGEWEVK